MLGLNDLLLATDLEAQQKRLATTAQQCGQALLALLDDVLDLSEVEAGKLELEAASFALRPTLSAALSLVAAGAAAKGLGVGLVVTSGSWPDGCPSPRTTSSTRWSPRC